MTAIYITLAVIIFWLVGVDIRYYRLSNKISIMHSTDKNLFGLVKSIKESNEQKETKKEEDKPEVKRNNKKRIIKKSKRVRAPKVSS